MEGRLRSLKTQDSFHEDVGKTEIKRLHTGGNNGKKGTVLLIKQNRPLFSIAINNALRFDPVQVANPREMLPVKGKDIGDIQFFH